jgi:hypothetical protein
MIAVAENLDGIKVARRSVTVIGDDELSSPASRDVRDIIAILQ